MPPLPGPAAYRFPVRAWRSVITVSIAPGQEREEEGVYVRVSDMRGGLASTDAEHAAPRIADLVREIIGGITKSARQLGAGLWFVPQWRAPAVVWQIEEACQTYSVRTEQQREASQAALAEYLRGPDPESMRSQSDQLLNVRVNLAGR